MCISLDSVGPGACRVRAQRHHPVAPANRQDPADRPAPPSTAAPCAAATRATTPHPARHRFLESARADDDPLYAAYVLVLALGLRKGEVLGLVWDDVNLDTGNLTMGRQLQRVGGQLLPRETKTACDAPLPGICLTALHRRQDQQATARQAPASPGTTADGSSPLGGVRRSNRVTSAAPGMPAVQRQTSGRSPCTTAGAPAPRCSSTWTCTPERSCRSSGMHRSR